MLATSTIRRPAESSTFTPVSVTPLVQPIDQSFMLSGPLRLLLILETTIAFAGPLLRIVGASSTSRTNNATRVRTTQGHRRRLFLRGVLPGSAGVEFKSLLSVMIVPE